MKIMLTGGTGCISGDIAALAIEQGHELYMLNRGSMSEFVAEGAKVIIGDIHNYEKTRALVKNLRFDVVADFLSYGLSDLKTTLDIFKDCYKQFIFISSAAVYSNLNGTDILEEEKSLVGNNVWTYGRNKILCENFLKEQSAKNGLKFTIVRPSFTYNRLRLLYPVGPTHQRFSWTIANRILHGKALPMHGDGNALAAAMSTKDFAKAFIGLCGNTKAYGEAYHIASEDFHTWNRLAQMMGEALGKNTILRHIPAHVLGFELGGDFGEKLNHFSFSHIFSMQKICTVLPHYESTVPFYQGIRECIDFYESNPQYKIIDEDFDRKMDYLCDKYKKQ